jgi:oligopeptide transport system ATP-binding protein
LQDDQNTATILITHDLGVVAGMCRRVIVLYGGKIVEEGTAREVFYHARHPYTWGLLRSIPQRGGRRQKLVPIPGTPPDLIHPPQGCPFYPRCPHAMVVCARAMPERRQLSDTHAAACRLLDEGAPKVVPMAAWGEVVE